MITQQHMDLISSIYDLPLQPEGWQSVLDNFAPIMGAAGATIMAFDPLYAEHYVSKHTSNFNVELLQEFIERFGKEDSNELAKILMNPVREFISDIDHLGITLEQHSQMPQIQFSKEHFNLEHRAISSLNLNRAWTDMLAVQHTSEHGPIRDDEKSIGSFFIDHFAKAIELSRSFSVLKSRFDGVLTALDRFHIGIFLLSPNGSVVVKNAEAVRILDAGDGLTLSRDGHLQPNQDGDRGQLKDIIARAVSTAQAQDNRAEQLMTLSRRSGDDPYLVEVVPIRDHGEIERAFQGALMFVIDPTKTDMVSTEGMQMLYQLTGAESDTCKLIAEGMDTDDVADIRNNTRETVRTHIKKILQKTGVNNRAQLVRLALKVNLPIDKPTGDA